MDLPDAKSIYGFAACGRIHNYETLYATTDAHCFHFVIFVVLRILIKVDKTKQTKPIWMIPGIYSGLEEIIAVSQ